MWMDKKADDMTLDELRQAVKDMRKFLAQDTVGNMKRTDLFSDDAKKPPLGCRPAWLISRERILELSEAIERWAKSSQKDVSHIREWATEIYCHCVILEYCGWKI